MRVAVYVLRTLLEDDAPPPGAVDDDAEVRELISHSAEGYHEKLSELARAGTINAETAPLHDRFYHRKLRYKTDSSRPLEARRTGKTKLWKTRPDQFRIPVKYGMYDAFYIDNSNAHEWSTTPNPEP